MRDVTFIMPRALVRLDPANQKKRCLGAYGLQKMLVKFDVLTARVINMSKSVQFFSWTSLTPNDKYLDKMVCNITNSRLKKINTY